MAKRPRHPEVDQERAPRLEPNNQVLAAPVDRDDPLALELARDLDRVERARQARVDDLDPLERRPSSTGARRRRTLSTSGSSGTGTR